MVYGDARDGGDDGVGDGGCVEGVGVADGQKEARDPRQGGDVSRVDRIDGDVGVRS